MRIGIVGTKGGWSTEKLADAVENLTGSRVVMEMHDVVLDLPSGTARHGEVELDALDGIIIKKIGGMYSQDMLDRLEILRYLNEKGLPVFSNPLRVMRVLDRLSCTVTLQSAGIPMPPTTITESVDEAVDCIARYGEAVLKPLYSTKAHGMVKVSPGPDTRAVVEEFQRDSRVMYIQKLLELPGRDLGVVFLGGEYLATYARCMNGDSWTTSTAFGGTYGTHEPSDEVVELARKAQAIFGLDFTCVDVVEADGGPYVFEVSAFGGFRGIQKTSGMDVARRYAEYVISRVKERQPCAI